LLPLFDARLLLLPAALMLIDAAADVSRLITIFATCQRLPPRDFDAAPL